MAQCNISSFNAAPLTPRESEVLQLLAAGKTTKEIAVKLGLASATVATYRKRLCRNIGAHSTAELIAYACHMYPH